VLKGWLAPPCDLLGTRDTPDVVDFADLCCGLIAWPLLAST
jgi:hypothetical protein